MTETILAGQALVKVLQEWDVKHIYGIPGGSINSLMEGLNREKDHIEYIQVRHEEVGAMAASMHAKYTGHIGVAFGSAGPGGTHLLNGLYDAREDHVPVLAIIGQFGTTGLNMDTFQEMNENPIYEDVAVYNRQISTAEQIPHIIDEAIRRAYKYQGVAVVQLPVDLGYQNIPKQQIYSTAKNYRPTPHPTLNESDIDQAVAMLKKAKRPLIYAGIGTRGAEAEVRRFAEKIKAPIITTGIAIDVIPNATPYWLGSVNRVGMKASNEAIAQADTVLFVGNNYPFAEVTNIFKHIQQFIQIDIDASHLGKRHLADVAILGDAKEAILALTEKVEDVPETPWWKANIENNQNWQEYLHHLEEKTEGEIELYQVYRGIRSIMEEDAILSVDVGDVTQTSVRHLHLNGKQKWRTSALFATMGVGVPGAIAAKLDFPSKQVLSLSGDGAFNMVMQDLKTQVQYRLPIINVVFSNRQFGFIKDEQEETNSGYIGVQFEDIDYAMVGVAMGATSFKITDASDVEEVFQKAREAQLNGETVLIDAKIKQDRPIPTESLVLDDVKFTPYEVAKFKTRYKAKNLHPFRYFLEKNGLSYEDRITELGGF